MTQKIRVVKEFSFETAHALDGYHGKCVNIHGHTYKLSVAVFGIPAIDKSDSKCGMVMDFGELKSLVKSKVIGLFDHRLLLRNDSRFRGIEKRDRAVRYVPYQPTCENMLLEIVGILKPALPQGVGLVKVLLRETESSYAEWNENDF